MVKRIKKSIEAEQLSSKDSSILKSDVRDVAVSFWKYLQKDSKDTFLDSDIKSATKWVFYFLQQDVVGTKIVLLDDEKLKAANVVARALKRKRTIIKTDQRTKVVANVKSIYKYLHNPFWQNSLMVVRLRKYIDSHLRRMTPDVITGLTANVEKLQTYFNGIVLDNSILTTDKRLKQIAMDLGYKQFGICEKHKQPLVKNEGGDILCVCTDCSTGKCPFEAIKAHGEEAVFLSDLGKLLTQSRSE